jgi:hypothetical protein
VLLLLLLPRGVLPEINRHRTYTELRLAVIKRVHKLCKRPSYKKCDETGCNNYRGISLLSAACNILFIILLARLTPYVNEIIEDHQCGFRRNRSTMDQIFYIQQILEKMEV